MRNNPHFFPRKSALPSIASERSRGRRQCFLQFTIRVHRCPSVVKKSMWEMVGKGGKTTSKSGKNLPFRTAFSHLRPKWQYSGGRERGSEIGPSLRSLILNSSFHVLLSNATTLAHPIALSNTFKPTPFRCSTPTCYRQNLLLPGHHPLILKDTLPFSQIIKALASTVAVFCTFGEARAGHPFA